MRVNIQHDEIEKGLFRKTKYYKVTVEVTFTEEEKHVIKENKVESHIVVERGVPADQNPDKFADLGDIFHLTVGRLMRGTDEYVLGSPADAREYDEILKGSLQNLKAFIDQNTGGAAESSTFEL